MPKLAQTIEQLEDSMGLPIIVFTAFDETTKTYMSLRLRDLGVIAVANAVAWLNARSSTP
jgi:hypothetical protein